MQKGDFPGQEVAEQWHRDGGRGACEGGCVQPGLATAAPSGGLIDEGSANFLKIKGSGGGKVHPPRFPRLHSWFIYSPVLLSPEAFWILGLVFLQWNEKVDLC